MNKPTKQHTKALLQKLQDITAADKGVEGRTKSDFREQAWLLNELGNCEDHFVIVPLLSHLVSRHQVISRAAGHALGKLMASVPESALSSLEDRVRRSPYYFRDWEADWVKLQPNHCDKVLGEQTKICGLVSCHPNGFVRALAVEELALRLDGADPPGR